MKRCYTFSFLLFSEKFDGSYSEMKSYLYNKRDCEEADDGYNVYMGYVYLYFSFNVGHHRPVYQRVNAGTEKHFLGVAYDGEYKRIAAPGIRVKYFN